MSDRALSGRGLLAIWNGIEPGNDEEFLRWHVGEHIPERLSVPGFLRARRYRAVEANPTYFNFYEVKDPDVLQSKAYLDRLNNPSDWTKRVVPYFTDTSRILCSVIESRGQGIAGFIWAIRLEATPEMALPILKQLTASPDVSATHIVGREEVTTAGTSESAMRSAPDGSSRSILLIEGASPELLSAAVDELASDASFEEVCGSAPTHRGLYQLDFLMSSPNQARTEDPR